VRNGNNLLNVWQVGHLACKIPLLVIKKKLNGEEEKLGFRMDKRPGYLRGTVRHSMLVKILSTAARFYEKPHFKRTAVRE